MASVRALDGASDLEHRSVEGSIPGRGIFTGLADYWNAIREGGAAAHAYEQLVRRGTPHEEAVARVFQDHFSRR